jgi:hypothetical protein
MLILLRQIDVGQVLNGRAAQMLGFFHLNGTDYKQKCQKFHCPFLHIKALVVINFGQNRAFLYILNLHISNCKHLHSI